MREISSVRKLIFVTPVITGRNALEADTGFFHQPLADIEIIPDFIVWVMSLDKLLEFFHLS